MFLVYKSIKVPASTDKLETMREFGIILQEDEVGHRVAYVAVMGKEDFK